MGTGGHIAAIRAFGLTGYEGMRLLQLSILSFENRFYRSAAIQAGIFPVKIADADFMGLGDAGDPLEIDIFSQRLLVLMGATNRASPGIAALCAIYITIFLIEGMELQPRG